MSFPQRCKGLMVLVLAGWLAWPASASAELSPEAPEESLADTLSELAAPPAVPATSQAVLAGFWEPLIARLAADGIDEAKARELFSRPEVAFHPGVMASKLSALLKARFEGPPPGPGSLGGVHRAFLRPRAIAAARSFMRSNSAHLSSVEGSFGVPREVVVAVMLVETRLGEYVGARPAFNTLASMARSGELEEVAHHMDARLLQPSREEYAREVLRRKSDWAYDELRALLAYAQRGGLDPLSIRGSVYGAIGLCQFMPSNASTFGVDGDHDGRLDLFTTCDALHSIANYLRGHGWPQGRDRAGQRKAIFAYNHSAIYVNTVLAVADRLSGKSAAPSKAKAGPKKAKGGKSKTPPSRRA